MINDLVPKSLAVKMDAWRREGQPWKPLPYMERALKFMLEHSQSGLLLDPGLRKTSITLAAAKILLQRKMIHRVLVVAQLRVMYDVWPREVCKWQDFHNFRVALLHGDRDKALRALRPEHQIVVINPEGFAWLLERSERMRLLGADMLVVDESSKFRNTNSVRFRAMRKAVGFFKRRHILTGSPRPKNYLDLFGQIFILDRGAALGAFVTHYRNNYFYPTGYNGYEWALVPGRDKDINRLVAPLVLRLDSKDYLKLPRELERIHNVELPEKVQTEYDAIEDNLMSKLFTEPLVNSAAARSKCCQLANGSVYTDQPGAERVVARPYKVIHSAKVDALVDLYEELQGEPLLISIGYHHDVAAIRAALDKNMPCINSDCTRTQASDFIDKWNRGLLPALMVHPASGGHGLNLQEFNARHVAVFDIPDDYDLFDQLYRRVRRSGNTAAFVMRHLFVTRNTVDQAKLINLRKKGSGQKDFLDAMREYAEKRYNLGRRKS
jgi:SNF2 family DNA or RNA helicase